MKRAILMAAVLVATGCGAGDSGGIDCNAYSTCERMDCVGKDTLLGHSKNLCDCQAPAPAELVPCECSIRDGRAAITGRCLGGFQRICARSGNTVEVEKADRSGPERYCTIPPSGDWTCTWASDGTPAPSDDFECVGI